MGVFSRIKDTLSSLINLDDSEIYDEVNNYPDEIMEDEYNKPKENEKAKSKMKLPNFVPNLKQNQINSNEQNQNVNQIIPQQKNIKQGEMGMFSPKSFEEVANIGILIKQGGTAVVNLVGIQVSLATRIIDFLTGLVYALDGDMKEISDNVFVASFTQNLNQGFTQFDTPLNILQNNTNPFVNTNINNQMSMQNNTQYPNPNNQFPMQNQFPNTQNNGMDPFSNNPFLNTNNNMQMNAPFDNNQNINQNNNPFQNFYANQNPFFNLNQNDNNLNSQNNPNNLNNQNNIFGNRG
ncbi:MAG: cell division protein SepF [Eubacteriales bacterium]|nr:cell division protein SepF [Eubacteriales bacterium]